MCGITGVFRASPSGDPLPELVRRMTEPVRHRGPDDAGCWSDEASGIALGFRRLAILDLSDAGHQPMHSPSGRYTIVYNGEIYNFVELRECLESRGHRFRGHSDTEVALAAFEVWGVLDSLRRFNGMFAMGIWDARRRSLVLARDRIGIKPLYVYRSPGLVLFASELKSILAVPGIRRDLDPDGLTAFLRNLYVPAPQSILKQVTKLSPGHWWEIFDPGRTLPDSTPYWSLDSVVRRRSRDLGRSHPEELVDRVEALLTDAIRIRTRADVPVGAFLSGGIDSSLVVALMQKATANPVRTFTVGFDVQEHDESAHARAVADHLGTDHTDVRMGEDEVRDVVPMIPEIFDEPHADPSQLPTYLVSRVARQSVTVALSGDGGDELFGGYNRYIGGAPTIRRLQGVPRPLRRALGRGILALPQTRWASAATVAARALPGIPSVRLPGEKMHKLGRLMCADEPWQMYESLMSAWPDPRSLTHAGDSGRGGLEEVLSGQTPKTLEDRMMLADQRGYLPDDLLAKVDRASMAVSLEVRVPLLDHRMVEHSWALPLDTKIQGTEGKWVLRRILDRHVPRHLVERPKVGFTVPIAQWLRGDLRPWAEDFMTAEALKRSQLLRPEAVQTTWKEFQEGREGSALGLWAVVIFQAWHDQWM